MSEIDETVAIRPELKERIRSLFRGDLEFFGEPITDYRERLDYFSHTTNRNEILGRSVVIDYTNHGLVLDQDLDIPYEELFQKKIIDEPEKVFEEMNTILLEVLEEIHGDEALALAPLYTRIRNLNPEASGLEDFRSDKNGKLIEIVGTVLQSSKKRSVLVTGRYFCKKCQTPFEWKQPYNFQHKAPHCTNEDCDFYSKSGNHIVIDADGSKPVDYQEITIQNNMMDGEAKIETMVNCLARDDIVNVVKAGEDVRVTGVIKSSPLFNVNKDMFGDPELMQVIYISNIELTSQDQNIEYDYTEEDFRAKVATAELEEQWWNEAIELIAPSINGLTHLKESVLLQLISGSEVINRDGTKRRGTINVMIVGDPGTGKSTIGLSAEPMARKYQYMSTQNATAAGMTAAVVKEGQGPWMVMAGATVLANGGLCVIDEFEKMRSTDMTKLHEQLSNQRIILRKAGIHKNLPAKCDVLALANPKTSRWMSELGLKKNLKGVPASIYNRFDLIYILRDQVEESFDRKTIRHINKSCMRRAIRDRYCEQHGIESTSAEDEDYGENQSFLRDYIKYVRNECESRYTYEERKDGEVPISLSIEAADMQEEFFVRIRSQGYDDDQAPIPINVRNGESLYRLASARAKFANRDIILPRDMECAIRLYEHFLDDVFKDEEGNYDQNQIEHGLSSKNIAGARDKIIADALYELSQKPEYKQGVGMEDFIDYLIDCGIVKGRDANTASRKAEREIKTMTNEGTINMNRNNLSLSPTGRRLIEVDDVDNDLFNSYDDLDDDEEGKSVF